MSAEWTSLTRPGDPAWREEGVGFRRWERTTVLGTGVDVWAWATTEVLRWGVKTRSGFSVTPATAVTQGSRPVIMAHPFGLSIREPVEVVDVVETSDRVGFAYRTLAGHPVSGEEAFVVHREGDVVLLTIRSLTRPASTPFWKLVYPALVVAQTVARHRYTRALRRRASR
ncbi:DUF1990 domain-containing protein [Microbacterium sp. HD4P20]|uniref:DUF1990 family protein n=1 Tax=Microbacterium sp. HD4P20 TaxID=2864874 RepID=UPI001C641F67|nr:DUF1990 family protein [Microbacterium sp. HD4P20]MCP2635026.1 DUF1990 domain-containing protein [Microbacterium sp. HD4P20]